MVVLQLLLLLLLLLLHVLDLGFFDAGCRKQQIQVLIQHPASISARWIRLPRHLIGARSSVI
jgi:hypothetical protein